MGNCYGDDAGISGADGVTTALASSNSRLTVKKTFRARTTDREANSTLIEIKEGTQFTITQEKPQTNWVEIQICSSNERVWVKKINWDKIDYTPSINA